MTRRQGLAAITIEVGRRMSKKEIIAQELDNASEKDRDVVLRVIRTLKSKRTEDPAPAVLSEPALAKDRLKPEEEEAWADL
jgi:hypothetical protein